jgi:hypothetical protein
MSTRTKQKKSGRKDAPSYSTRPRGKSGKILTVERTGMPCFGKMEKTVGFQSETPAIYEMVMIYESCHSCGLSLGQFEVKNGDELSGMCLDCFKEAIGEKSPFDQINKYKSICIKCVGYMEENKELFSTMEKVCNHGYMKITGTNKNHSCIQCDPLFLTPPNNLHEKTQVVNSVENPKIFSKTNKLKTFENGGNL